MQPSRADWIISWPVTTCEKKTTPYLMVRNNLRRQDLRTRRARAGGGRLRTEKQSHLREAEQARAKMATSLFYAALPPYHVLYGPGCYPQHCASCTTAEA